MAKIVYNKCFGGFGLSNKAVDRYFELMGWELVVVTKRYGYKYYYSQHDGKHFNDHELERDDPVLVQVVEELGSVANGDYSELAICELPSGTRYYIHEYDGCETVVTEDEFRWRTA